MAVEKWTPAAEKQPDSPGFYRVKRAGIGRRPAYEDICGYDPGTQRWTNLQGVVISSVLLWMEGSVDP